jgi:hypothetical protein
MSIHILDDPRPCVHCGKPLTYGRLEAGYRDDPHRHDPLAHRGEYDPDCHTYEPKEEPMPKREPLTVHLGRIIRLDWDENQSGVAEVDVTIRVAVGVGESPPVLRSLGREAVLGGSLTDVTQAMGPSPEERAVIDAALQWVQAVEELGIIPKAKGRTAELLTAVKALKEAK